MPNPDTSYTHTSQIHEPSGFCYRVVCAHSKHSMDAVVYRGQNVVEPLSIDFGNVKNISPPSLTTL